MIALISDENFNLDLITYILIMRKIMLYTVGFVLECKSN